MGWFVFVLVFMVATVLGAATSRGLLNEVAYVATRLVINKAKTRFWAAPLVVAAFLVATVLSIIEELLGVIAFVAAIASVVIWFVEYIAGAPSPYMPKLVVICVVFAVGYFSAYYLYKREG